MRKRQKWVDGDLFWGWVEIFNLKSKSWTIHVRDEIEDVCFRWDYSIWNYQWKASCPVLITVWLWHPSKGDVQFDEELEQPMVVHMLFKLETEFEKTKPKRYGLGYCQWSLGSWEGSHVVQRTVGVSVKLRSHSVWWVRGWQCYWYVIAASRCVRRMPLLGIYCTGKLESPSWLCLRTEEASGLNDESTLRDW